MENSARSETVSAMLSAHPGPAIVKFWQGIVEISLRVTAIVLAIPILISAAYATAVIGSYYKYNYSKNSKNSANLLIFVPLVVMVIQGVGIAGRFLNFSFISAFIKIVLLMDIIVNAVISILLLIGGAITAWSSTLMWGPTSAFASVAIFSFLLMLDLIGLIVWMSLFLRFKWNNKVVQHSMPNREESFQ